MPGGADILLVVSGTASYGDGGNILYFNQAFMLSPGVNPEDKGKCRLYWFCVTRQALS